MRVWHSQEGFPKRLKPCQREMETCVKFCKRARGTTILRLENWKRARAPFCPYFFLSTILESRVKNPPFFNEALKDSSALMSARAIPCEIAPACPVFPPPFTLTWTAYSPPFSTCSMGRCATSEWSARSKYS